MNPFPFIASPLTDITKAFTYSVKMLCGVAICTLQGAHSTTPSR